MDDTNNTAAVPATNTATPAKPAPAPKKTEAGKILAGIGGFLSKEVSQIGKLFKTASPVIQQDIKDASGILQIIKTDASADGAVLVYLIKKAYPSFDEAKLHTLLTAGITNLGMASSLIGDDLLTTVGNIAKYAVTLTGNAHNTFWNSLCNLVVAELQPQLPWSRIVTLVEWVYQNLIKPKA